MHVFPGAISHVKDGRKYASAQHPHIQQVRISKHKKESKIRLETNDLPVDREAINENRVSLLRGRLAEALE